MSRRRRMRRGRRKKGRGKRKRKRKRRRRKQLLDNLKKKRRYCNLQQEAPDLTV